MQIDEKTAKERLAQGLPVHASFINLDGNLSIRYSIKSITSKNIIFTNDAKCARSNLGQLEYHDNLETIPRF